MICAWVKDKRMNNTFYCRGLVKCGETPSNDLITFGSFHGPSEEVSYLGLNLNVQLTSFIIYHINLELGPHENVSV